MSVTASAWGGIIIGLLLLMVGVPLVARIVARLDDDPRMFRLVMWSGALKLACAPLWIYVIDHLYGGVADAYTYSSAGLVVAEQIRHGNLSFHVGSVLGDGGTEIVTGILYVFTGSSFLGEFFVFGFLSFISLVVFYRAFRVALPDGDARRYAWLVLFFPSLLFWTSAIGKDALISLGLSVAALGGARLLTRRRGGFVLVAAGLGLTVLVRPHVALMLFAALALAYPFSRARKVSALGPFSKALQLVVLVGGGLLLAKLTAHFFGLSSLSTSSVQHVLQQNATNTGAAATNQVGQFGSSSAASTSLSPLAIPRDFYYTIMRPLPIEAHGLTQLASSLENTTIVVLLAVSWRRVLSALRAMLKHPYLITALVYSLVWILLFASIGNLGILARERTSLLPLLFVLLSWPAHRSVQKEPVLARGPAPRVLVGAGSAA